MARIHGRNGRLFMALASGGTPEPVAFLNKWSISFATDKPEVTAFGDTSKVYVSGLPDASGDFAGFLDTATAQMYTAAADGLPRGAYLYPDFTNTPTLYFYGSILPDFSIEVPVDGPATISGSWAASGAISKKP